MKPGRYRLPGSIAFEPLQQGHLSRLCGLYSIINGIQLAFYPERLPPKYLEAAFLSGVAYLSRTRRLGRILGVGMHEAAWLALCRAVASHANDALGSSLAIKPVLKGVALRSTTKAVQAVKGQIRDGNPVLVGLGGVLSHYTVVAGYSRDRLHLFDSSGLRWIDIRSIGLGDSSSSRHWLTAVGVVALVDDW